MGSSSRRPPPAPSAGTPRPTSGTAYAGWVERRRQTTWGTILLGVLGIFISIVFIQEPLGNFELLIRAAALWVGYLAVTEILRLVRAITAKQAEQRRALWPRLGDRRRRDRGDHRHRDRRLRADDTRSGEGRRKRATNRSATATSRCAISGSTRSRSRASHNAMSSAELPGLPVRGADRHDPRAAERRRARRCSSTRTTASLPRPASRVRHVPIVLTDKVGPGRRSGHEVDEDPVAAKRAAQLAASAPTAADARARHLPVPQQLRDGCRRRSQKPLSDIKSFLDSHPDDVLMVDHPGRHHARRHRRGVRRGRARRSRGDAAAGRAAPDASGRSSTAGERCWCSPSAAIPAGRPGTTTCTTGSRRRRSRSPARSSSTAQPNRGNPDAPLFLINHWVTIVAAEPGDGRPTRTPTPSSRSASSSASENEASLPTSSPWTSPNAETSSPTTQELNEEQLKEQRTRAQEEQIPAQPPPERGRPAPDVGAGHPAPGAAARHDLDRRRPGPVLPCSPGRRELSITAWAVAVLQDDPSEAGLTDLAYAPGARRRSRPRTSAPLLRSSPPRRSRSRPRPRRGGPSLAALGLKDRDIKRLAKAAPNALLGPDSPDGTAVRDKLIEQLEKKVEPEQLRQAATEFLDAQGDPTGLMDLGNVPQEVGVAAGYPCASARQ